MQVTVQERLAGDLESNFGYESCNYESLAKELELPGRFILSNDGHGRIVKNLEDVCAIDLNQNELAVGLVIGESNFLSLANLIQKHAKFWISVEIDPLVARHLAHQIQCINSNGSIDEYMQAYLTFWNDSSLPKNVNVRPECYKQYVSEQMKGQGFLDSSENYEAARKAIASMRVVHLNINMFDSEVTGLLATILKTNQAQITFLNLTNVHDYIRASYISIPFLEGTLTTKDKTGDVNFASALLDISNNPSIPTIHSDGNICIQDTDLVTLSQYIERLAQGTLSSIGVHRNMPLAFSDYKTPEPFISLMNRFISPK